jgi:hypothetical protein
MHTKYARLNSRKPAPGIDARCLVPEHTQSTQNLQDTRWGEQTYAAARELRETAAQALGWMPFSAPGLSVGPSMLRNHVRVDLLDHDGTPRSLLVSSADLVRWLAVLQ